MRASDGLGAVTLLLLFATLFSFALVGIWLTLGADVRVARRHLGQLVTLLEELNAVPVSLACVEQVERVREALRDHSDHSMSKLPVLQALVHTSVRAAYLDSDLLQQALEEAQAAHRSLGPRRGLENWRRQAVAWGRLAPRWPSR